jgi:hypothetical protein
MTAPTTVKDRANPADGSGGGHLYDVTKWPRLSDQEIAQHDIAQWNLISAVGLSGLTEQQVPPLIARLDRWANRVRLETNRHLYRYRENPADYEDSEAYFRLLMLITVTQQDFGVHYNLGVMCDPVDQTNPEDWFVHGLLRGSGGTCASMPVLVVALGRRLGYPLKLVHAKEHVFARWDDPHGERRNFECAGRGLSSYPDEHYRKWPLPIDPSEIESYGLLDSLSPRQELASFAAQRATCLLDQLQVDEAISAASVARQLCPNHRGYFGLHGMLNMFAAHLSGRCRYALKPEGNETLATTPEGARLLNAAEMSLLSQFQYEVSRLNVVRRKRGLPVPESINLGNVEKVRRRKKRKAKKR